MNLLKAKKISKKSNSLNSIKSSVYTSFISTNIAINGTSPFWTNPVKILGIKYPINLHYKNIKKPTINFINTNIDIILPNKYKRFSEDQIIMVLTKKLYDKIAENELEKIMEKVRIETGIAPEDYEIKRIPKSLAKCDVEKSFITINPDIIAYDEQTIEYIILHEFCHLKYKIRTKNFWKMVKTYMPNYEQYANSIGNLSY